MQGSELSQKIEEIVRRAVTSVVEDINSSLTDVRDAVNQQFEAAVQSVMADAQSVSISDELQSLLAEQDEASGQAPAPAQSAPSGTGVRDLKNAIQEVERGASQVEVLNSMLEQALEFSSRAALLVLKGDAFSGWKGRGFTETGGDDELIKRLTVEPGSIAELDAVRQHETGTAWDGSSFAARASIAAPEGALLIPMVIKDKVAAALYADQVAGGSRLDRHALELLVFTTGLLVDTLSIRKKIPSPTLSREAADEDPFDGGDVPEPELGIEMEPAPAAEEPPPSQPEVVTQVAAPGGFGAPEPQTPPQAPPAGQMPPPSGFGEEPSEGFSTQSTTKVEPPPPAAPPEPELAPPSQPSPSQVTPPSDFSPPTAPVMPEADFGAPAGQEASPAEMTPPAAPQPTIPAPEPPSTQVAPPEPEPASTQVAPPPAEPAPPTQVSPPAANEASTQVNPPADAPSTQYVPPPELQKSAPGIGTAASTDTRQHDDAKRFARLLVSEIKLYNEGKVDQGRKNGDLYERLKEDIDRSRQMFEERVPEEVRSVTNYFYDELVRILADGDPDALGL